MYFTNPLELGSYLRTGMKKVWIANACPMEAAKFTAPDPKRGIVLSPEGAVAISQIKKIQYPIMLMIPYPRSEAPK